uniref:Uncharacterized protein n=1 Tax=Arundo donax TaxID=35708 RepID=A0A0A8YYL3_ARUDO
MVHNGACFIVPWFLCFNHLGWAGYISNFGFPQSCKRQ